MNNIKRLSVLILVLAFVSGCASNGGIARHNDPICVIAGAVAGGAGGLMVENEEAAFAVGALAGGALAWLICDDEKDSDGDGIVDSKDNCRATPRGVAVNAVGCPLDNDRDGVPDSQDQCPDTPRGTSVDKQGCTVDGDSDGDGVSDSMDQCADTPRGASVDKQGCTVDGDSDGDGVKDSMDQCADTPAGKSVNDTGCHTILSLTGVNFQLNSSVLGQEAKTALDSVAEMMKVDTGVKLRVEGHTDSSGAESYNQRLSQGRAESVVDYLVANGIDRARLSPAGYGEARPVAGNDTPEGRASNRRVDLVAGN